MCIEHPLHYTHQECGLSFPSIDLKSAIGSLSISVTGESKSKKTKGYLNTLANFSACFKVRDTAPPFSLDSRLKSLDADNSEYKDHMRLHAHLIIEVLI